MRVRFFGPKRSRRGDISLEKLAYGCCFCRWEVLSALGALPPLEEFQAIARAYRDRHGAPRLGKRFVWVLVDE